MIDQEARARVMKGLAIFNFDPDYPGAPNLDAVCTLEDANKLRTWCDLVGTSNVIAAKVMFPDGDPIERLRMVNKLRRYAGSKAEAVRLRAGGKVFEALKYESLCDDIYRTMFDWARW